MELKCSNENITLQNIIEDLREIEKTETTIWQFHNQENLKGLYSNIKERQNKFFELTIFFKTFSREHENVKREIENNYPQISKIHFKNNYHEISHAFEQLQYFLKEQSERLNISEILLEKTKREQILNGNKVNPNESEFTTLMKRIIQTLNSPEYLESIGETAFKHEEKQTIEEKETPVKEEQSPETNQQPIEEIQPETELIEPEEIKTIEEQTPVTEEKSPEIEQEPTNQPENKTEEQELEIIEIEKEMKQNEIQDNFTNELEEIRPVEEEDVTKKSFIVKKEEPEETNENEDIENTIREYFSYSDAMELTDDEKSQILEKTLKNNSAKKYAKILLKLKNQGLMPRVDNLVREIFAKTITQLTSYSVNPRPYTYSNSWVYWDIAKQIYYLDNPGESNSNYLLANPLESPEKIQEIIDRHIGWEIYSQMDTGEINGFLNRIRDPIYGKRVIDVMIAKANKKFDHFSSYKMAELGKNVRLGLAEKN